VALCHAFNEIIGSRIEMKIYLFISFDAFNEFNMYQLKWELFIYSFHLTHVMNSVPMN